MPRKAAANTTKKAAPVRKRKGAPVEQAVSSSTLADVEYDREMKRIKKNTTTFDAQLKAAVQKCIRDNLADLTEEELYRNIVDDISCYKRLFKDKHTALTDKKKAPSFGKLYFQDLRLKYQVAEVADGLVVHTDEAPNPALFAAVQESREEEKRENLSVSASRRLTSRTKEKYVVCWGMLWS